MYCGFLNVETISFLKIISENRIAHNITKICVIIGNNNWFIIDNNDRFNNWKKALESFVDHQQSKAHRAAITYESLVPQCGDVLVMTVNDRLSKFF